MSRASFRHAAGLAAALATVLPLGARAAPLDMPAPFVGMVRPADAQALRPAPLPNLDIEEPGPNSQALAAQADPKLGPGIFSRQSHFSGDGYAPGSNLEADQDHRHALGGGMNLSIPMP